LGPTKWFLGIHIIRDRSKRTLSLFQHQYCIDMLEEFGMADAGLSRLPWLLALISMPPCPHRHLLTLRK
jgi:hypothetical protein